MKGDRRWVSEGCVSEGGCQREGVTGCVSSGVFRVSFSGVSLVDFNSGCVDLFHQRGIVANVIRSSHPLGFFHLPHLDIARVSVDGIHKRRPPRRPPAYTVALVLTD